MCAMLTYVRLQRARDRNERRLAARKEAVRNAPPPHEPVVPSLPKIEKPRLSHAARQAQRLALLAKKVKDPHKRKSLKVAATKWAARALETDEQREARKQSEADCAVASVAARVARAAAIEATRLLREAMETPTQRAVRLSHGNRRDKGPTPKKKIARRDAWAGAHDRAIAVIREAIELRKQRSLASKTKRIRRRTAPPLPY